MKDSGNLDFSGFLGFKKTCFFTPPQHTPGRDWTNEQITGMIMAVNLALHLQRNIGPTLYALSTTCTKLTVNDTGSIVRHWSPRKLCALTRVGAHRFGDQCLSPPTGGVAAEGPIKRTRSVW